jgi:enoyl-CoA hydratase
LLLYGAGGLFSSGLNLKEVLELNAETARTFLGNFDSLCRELFTYPGPTVAAVNGHAIAGGSVLALCCDFNVAGRDEKARVGLNEIALGVRFPPWAFHAVKERMPRRGLNEAILGAELHGPARAVELGLVDALSDDPMAAARARLEWLAALPRETYAATKRRIQAVSPTPTDADWERYAAEEVPAWCSEGVRAKIRAHLSRR